MSYSAKILADSVNEAGCRLTTFELQYPRFVHAQLMTHRTFSRNAASSRAIPTQKMIEKIEADPVMPMFWGRNKRGMQASEELNDKERAVGEEIWIKARDQAVVSARSLMLLGAHKQIVNRLLEPWMYITVIVSATEFENWYHLRGADAQPEIAWVASAMHDCAEDSEPEELIPGAWHLPLVELHDPENPLYVNLNELEERYNVVKISAARCARVSYLTHDGKRDLTADLALHDRLSKSGHWSPFEHPAMATAGVFRYGNYFGFKQYRKFFANEHFGKEMD